MAISNNLGFTRKKKGKTRNDSINDEESSIPNDKNHADDQKQNNNLELNQIELTEKRDDGSQSEQEEIEKLLEPLENLSIKKDKTEAEAEVEVEEQIELEEFKQNQIEKSEVSLVSSLEDNEDNPSKGLGNNDFKLEAMKSICKPLADSYSECTLESCLSRFTSSEFLSDKICCENCSKQESELNFNKPIKSYSNAIKQYLICELPLILTIHLKRFQQQGFRLVKSDKYVRFPLVLNMTPYTSLHCVNTNESDLILYSLYGVVEHSGRLNSGHYTAYVRTNLSESNHFKLENYMSKNRLCHLNKMLKKWQEKKDQGKSDQDSKKLDGDTTLKKEANDYIEGLENNLKNENWYYVSDSSVSSASLSRVLKCQAYILFYERIK
jgi:ubiquitin C-terminal hydrolase